MGAYSGLDCDDLGCGSGSLTCNECKIDISGCSNPSCFSSQEYCGDELINLDENCDLPDNGVYANLLCSDKNIDWSGNIQCINCKYNYNNCFYCGDGACNSPDENSINCSTDCLEIAVCGDSKITPPEECEDTNLNGETCVSQGYTGGTLSCIPVDQISECMFDKSNCFMCGDGACNSPDESPINCPIDCGTCGNGVCDTPSESFLNCPVDCDTCGNGYIYSPEICDDTNFIGDTCEKHGYLGGTLICNNCEEIITDNCTYSPPVIKNIIVIPKSGIVEKESDANTGVRVYGDPGVNYTLTATIKECRFYFFWKCWFGWSLTDKCSYNGEYSSKYDMVWVL